MKSRLSLIFAALIVLLASMVWLIQDRSKAAPLALATVPGPALRFLPDVAVSAPTVTVAAVPTTAPAAATTITPTKKVSPPTASAPVAAAPVAAAPVAPAAPMVRVDASGDLTYVARAGDTVSQLSVALMGSDSKDNRAAVIAANESLAANPDLVLEGQTYRMGSAAINDETAAEKPEPAGVASALSNKTEEAPLAKTAVDDRAAALDAAPRLTYTAQPGDSVAVLAGNLLGGDTKANREWIIANNPSLQQDPNHLVAGKAYTIAAPNGLAADPAAPQAKVSNEQPDADELAQASAGRVLRYTAQPGDTVSKLAITLMGSDTHSNRDLIVKSNPSLKADPDHLIAGRTYWIAAPTADAGQ